MQSQKNAIHCHFEKSVEARASVYRANFEKALSATLPETWIEDTRRRTAKFVFDEFPPDALEDFGFDLVKEDMFNLPFESCYFEWLFEGKVQTLLAQKTPDGRIHCWNPGQYGDEDVKGWGATAPFVFGLEPLKEHIAQGGSIDSYLGDRWGTHGECFRTSIREVISCVALLNSKVIDREVISPPDRVNQKRITTGRSPLPTYTIVRLSRYRKANGIGTHASPVPHLRRGHVRELASGKKTIVRPTFVMADPGTMPTYKVGKH